MAFTSAVAIKSERFRTIGPRLAIRVNASNKRKSGRKKIKVGKLSAFIVGALLWASMLDSASAADTLKLAIGQRGNWENAAPELGQQAGFFKRHGLDLDIIYTQGGGETQQAVISGSVNIGIGVGTGGAMAALAKSASGDAISTVLAAVGDNFRRLIRWRAFCCSEPYSLSPRSQPRLSPNRRENAFLRGRRSRPTE